MQALQDYSRDTVHVRNGQTEPAGMDRDISGMMLRNADIVSKFKPRPLHPTSAQNCAPDR